jgi:hypothetical protein
VFNSAELFLRPDKADTDHPFQSLAGRRRATIANLLWPLAALGFPSAISAATNNDGQSHHGVLSKPSSHTFYVVKASPLVDDTAFVNTNAMEKSRFHGWRYQKHRHEHVEDSTRYDTMRMSATAQDWWQTGKDVDVEPSADDLDSLQPTLSSPKKPGFYTRTRNWQLGGLNTFGYLFLVILSLCVLPTTAVEIEFENCLSNDVQNNQANGGLQLQFVPLFFDAVFNTTDPSHTLALRVWGNVTGTGPVVRQSPLPPPNSGYWDSNSTDSGGKIIDVPSPDTNNIHTTLASSIDVLTYQNAQDFTPFCDNLINGSCPLAPNFLGNA